MLDHRLEHRLQNRRSICCCSHMLLSEAISFGEFGSRLSFTYIDRSAQNFNVHRFVIFITFIVKFFTYNKDIGKVITFTAITQHIRSDINVTFTT